MSSLENRLSSAERKLASNTKLLNQISTIFKSKEFFIKICTDTSRLLEEHGITELLDDTKLFVRLEQEIRKNFSKARLSSTLHEIVVYKFRSLDAKASRFTEKFNETLTFINDMQTVWLQESTLKYSARKFSKMTEKVRDEVVKKIQDRTRATLEWKINVFEVLMAEWNGEKDTLLAEFRQCVQMLKDLRAGLEASKENEKGRQ